MSVIVPALNVAHLLPRCLDSLLAQHHRPLQIIVVDDGSTDDTAAVLRRYAELHQEVQVISQEHRGIGPARNAALRVARGPYIAMVDADDWVEPDFISDLVGVAEASRAEVVVGNFTFDFWGMRVGFPFLPRQEVLTGMQAARLTLHLTRFPAFAWNKLYRRELFVAGAPTFPCIIYEDLATTPRILSRANEVVILRKTYYHYCLRSDSITGNFGARNVFSFAAAIDILRHDLHASGRWESWRPSYLRLLREALVLIAIQVLLQPNRIPLRSRGRLLLRYGSRLRAMSRPPGDRDPAQH